MHFGGDVALTVCSIWQSIRSDGPSSNLPRRRHAQGVSTCRAALLSSPSELISHTVNAMTPHEQKRSDILKRYAETYRRDRRFYEVQGSGILHKFTRLVSAPRIYLPLVAWKLHLYPKENRTVRLFWGRELKADLTDSDIATLCFCRSLSLSPPEHKLTQFLIKNLNATDVFYDV